LFEAESQRTPIDVPDMVGFGPNGDSVLVSTLDKGEPVWKLLSLQDGKLGPPIEGAMISTGLSKIPPRIA